MDQFSIDETIRMINVHRFAVINAFNEEFTLRAAPLSKLLPVVGKQQSLMITTIYSGLGHYYGVPNGVPGVLLSSFLGWFLGKSLLD